jgi:hypothetical protein
MNDEKKKQDDLIEQLREELREYTMVEDVLIAAGLVSKERLEQAHDIVRNFP